MNEQEALKRKNAKIRELNAMAIRFPEAHKYCGGAIDAFNALGGDADIDDVELLFATYGRVIPLFHKPAHEAQLRSALSQMAAGAKSEDMREAAIRGIAESDIRSGIIHSTYVRKYPDLWESVSDLVAQHDEAYGAKVFSRSWKKLSRGGTLNYYFGNHEDLIAGKRILHIAPEAETSEWFRSRADALSMDYTTLNLGGDVDFVEDLTAMEIDDSQFDWIICHRVLEHIFDHKGAMSEAYRVLKPGGIFNVSVPESMHMPNSEEWLIPDLSHHHHYRQYGADVAPLLDSVGFETKPVSWVLDRTPEELDEGGAYPLRMYNACRS